MPVVKTAMDIVIKDRAFNQHLSERLDRLMENSCKQIVLGDLVKSSRWRSARNFFVFHLLRRYPAWAGLLAAHVPRVTLALGFSLKNTPLAMNVRPASPDSGQSTSINHAGPAA